MVLTQYVNAMLIIITCLFMLMDLITGFAQAVANKCVDSQKMKQGLWHKCGFLLSIVFGVLCEFSMNYVDLGFTVPIQNAICLFIILTECVSILENITKLSPELKSKKFMEIFAVVVPQETSIDGIDEE